MMIPMTADELKTLVQARDVLASKRKTGAPEPIHSAWHAVMKVLRVAVLDPGPK